MSVLEKIKSISEIPEDFMESAFSQKLEYFKNRLHYYNDYDKTFTFLLCKESFLKTWETFPDLRERMFSVLCYAATNDYIVANSDYYISAKEAKDLSLDIFESCEKNDDYFSSRVRAELSRILKKEDSRFKIDPIKEVSRLKDLKASALAINYWIEISIPLISKDDEYELLYNSVQKAEGYTALKNKIVELSFEKNIIMYDVLDKIAESSPVSLKRTALRNISNILEDIQNAIAIKDRKPDTRYGFYHRDAVPFETKRYMTYDGFDARYLPKDDIEVLKEKERKAQELMKKFLSAEDWQCMQMFCEHLGLDSLAWLLPNIVKHERLVNFVNDRINNNLGPRSFYKYGRRY